MRKTILMFPALFLLATNALAQHAFDGYFHPAEISVIPVWMEIRIPPSDGPVTGFYFYKRKGLPLRLEGTLRGNQIRMAESEKRGIVTGTLNLTRSGDSLTGTWTPPKENEMNQTLLTPVIFYPALPEEKKFAVFPKPKSLRLLDGKTFAQELKESAEAEENGNNPFEGLEFQSYRKNIVSLSIGGEYTGGAYQQSWSMHHNFDLESRREFQLEGEIDPGKSKAFRKSINDKLQAQLTKERGERDEDEWAGVFGDGSGDSESGSEDPLGACFNMKTHAECGTSGGPIYYYFKGNELHKSIERFFGFPHVSQAMDISLDVSIPLSELKGYLKKDSRLNRLVQDVR